jgi:DnaJ-domain-containing protein 1
MLTKMLLEIFQAIAEDPTVRRILGNYNLAGKPNMDVETLMNDLGLSPEEKVKFRQAHQAYQQNPNEAYERYKYKYEPKSNSAFDKFDAYFQKFEDQAQAHEEKYGKGTGDWSHRQYQKYRNNTNDQSSSFHDFKQSSAQSVEERKHLETLELKEGATFDEIKASYKSLMKKYHPDKFQDEEKKKYAESVSMKLNVAYEFFKKKHNA